MSVFGEACFRRSLDQLGRGRTHRLKGGGEGLKDTLAEETAPLEFQFIVVLFNDFS